MSEEAIAGLDIGSTKVCAVVAVPRYGELEVIGFGEAPSDGLERGTVTNLDAVVRSIEAATAAAEQMAGQPISKIYLGVNGDHVKTQNARASVPISNDRHEVGERDVARALDASRKTETADERYVLHALPRTYTVDACTGIVDPIGMEARRLEVDAQIVSGQRQMIANLLKCVSRAGLESVGLVFEPLASSAATLDREAMQSGVLLLDIGGGSTDIALCSKGRVVYTSTVPVGSSIFTRDIASELRTTWTEAERLKCAFDFTAPPERIVDVAVLAGRRDKRVELAKIRDVIAPRLSEMLRMIVADLTKVTERDVRVEEVVLTGGGANLMGIEGPVADFFGLPARVGVPAMVEGLTEEMRQPQYATAVGLLVYGPLGTPKTPRPRKRTLVTRLTTWFSDLWN